MSLAEKRGAQEKAKANFDMEKLFCLSVCSVGPYLTVSKVTQSGLLPFFGCLFRRLSGSRQPYPLGRACPTSC
jgi:hypothetical protein